MAQLVYLNSDGVYVPYESPPQPTIEQQIEEHNRYMTELAVDRIILEAAKAELRWGVGDARHNPENWKRDVRKRLWEELGIDLEEYT